MISSQLHFKQPFFNLGMDTIIHQKKYNKWCYISLKIVENIEKFTKWQRDEQTAIRISYFKISGEKNKNKH